MSKAAVGWNSSRPAKVKKAERSGIFAVPAGVATVGAKAIVSLPAPEGPAPIQARKIQGQAMAETAHDLNNALSSIRLHFDLLELECESAEKVRLRLGELRPAVEHAVLMARQLVNPERLHASGTALQPGPEIALNPVLRRIAPLLSGMLPPNADLFLRLAPDLRSVPLGPNQVVRVVSNLVRNSGAALRGKGDGPGGHVTIETMNWQIPGWVLLRVRDTGVGMSTAVRANIFRPYFTTKPPEEGTGLGLPSVLRIVQSAGGAIQVESTPGKGTEVAVLLPSRDARGSSVRSEPGSGVTAIRQESKRRPPRNDSALIEGTSNTFGPQRPVR